MGALADPKSKHDSRELGVRPFESYSPSFVFTKLVATNTAKGPGSSRGKLSRSKLPKPPRRSINLKSAIAPEGANASLRVARQRALQKQPRTDIGVGHLQPSCAAPMTKLYSHDSFRPAGCR